MTVADVTSQISDIRSRLAALAATVASSVDGGTGFASALSGATATAATGNGASTATGATTGDDIVKAALAYEGVPYVLGGESKSGIDCSGLVQAACRDAGVAVPRLVHEQQTIGEKVDSLKDAKPGDLIVLNGGNHIAIWAGNGTVIHAPYAGRTVSVQKAWFDDADVTAIRRVVPASDDMSAAAATAAATGPTGASGVVGGAGTVSASTTARATALMAMYGGGPTADSSATGLSGTGSGTDALAAMLSAYGSGSGTSSSTAQQLLAARAALLGTGA